MARLSKADLANSSAISREILTLDDSGQPLFTHVLPRLREFLETGMAGGYGVNRGESCGFELSYAYAHGTSEAKLAQVITAVIDATPNRWGLFDPSSPKTNQRNRADILDFPGAVQGPPGELQSVASQFFAASHRYQTDIHDCYQLRSLVCDGPSLLGWVGCAQPDPPTERQRLLLRSLIPAIQHRLRVERQLGEVTTSQSAFVAAMDSIPSAAFLCLRNGSIVHANALGLVRADNDAKGLAEELRAAIGGHSHVNVAPLLAVGCDAQFVVVLHAASDVFDLRLVRAATHWGLTRRQTEVLGHLARGETNRAIASILLCSDRTVEAHVTALLDKADVESRAQLMAAFWTLEA